MDVDYCTKKNVKIFLGVGAVMTVLCAVMDIWSLYLEAHMEILRKYSTDVDVLKPDATSRGILAAHTVLCSFQSGVMGSLAMSTSRVNNFTRDLNIFLTMLCLEYGLFLGYMIFPSNHYLYPFITACFISLAYKSIICTPLIDFRDSLRLSAETSGVAYTSNIAMWCTRMSPPDSTRSNDASNA